jgi:hypothetical protein
MHFVTRVWTRRVARLYTIECIVQWNRLSRKRLGRGHMYVYSFLLRMTDTVICPSTDLYSCDTLYSLVWLNGRWTGRDLEGSSRLLIEEGTEKIRKTWTRTAGVPAKIRTENLWNTSLERYPLIIPLASSYGLLMKYLKIVRNAVVRLYGVEWWDEKQTMNWKRFALQAPSRHAPNGS